MNDNIEEKIYQAVKKHKSSIVIRHELCAEKINQIVQKMLDDHPDVFFSEWQYVLYMTKVVIKPDYVYSQKEEMNLLEKCQEQAEIILSRVQGMSELQSIQRLHDILVRNIRYVDDGLFLRHTIVGALLDRKVVCDGYSKLFKYLLDQLGIENRIVKGRGFSHVLADSEVHSWNIVCYQGKWYHIDVTYDESLSVPGFIRYDYFFVSDQTISLDHYYNQEITPHASDDSIFPYAGKTIIKNRTDLFDEIKNNVEKKNQNIILRFHESFSEDAVKQAVQEGFSDFFLNKQEGFEIMFNINNTRNIVHVNLKTGA